MSTSRRRALEHVVEEMSRLVDQMVGLVERQEKKKSELPDRSDKVARAPFAYHTGHIEVVKASNPWAAPCLQKFTPGCNFVDTTPGCLALPPIILL